MFVLNIPNVLTIIRIVLIPVFIALYYRGLPVLAFAVYVAACLTDAGHMTLRFDAPQRAVTPGQSPVLYLGEACLGGGVIQ